jgi:phosphoribosylformylglycinamidine cyclo-ligase
MNSTYRESGVNLDAAAGWVNQLKQLAPGIGGFGGFYPLGENDLVASTDGVGTKLKLAVAMNRHDTIGIDLVAMNVNDILTCGATPLFFLDYMAVDKLDPEKLERVVRGITEGCKQAGCQLIGGETAQMSDLYREGDYDLAGFAVGIVQRRNRIDGSRIEKGDLIVGLASSGVHSNGFSLVRRIIDDGSLQDRFGSEGKTLGETLLTPTCIYVKRVQELMNQFAIKGMAHITGGAFSKNIPRMLPKGLTARIDEGSWPVLEIFHYLQRRGNISDIEMRRVFNRGIGFTLVLSADEARFLCRENQNCFLIGEIIEGESLAWR